MPGVSGTLGATVADLILRIIADATQYEAELKKADAALEKTTSEGKKKFKQYSNEAESALKKVQRSLHNLNRAVEGVSKRIDLAGWRALKTAAIMTGPFIAAMIKVRNTNQQVAWEFERMNAATNAIADTMADVAIPYARILADWMERLGNKIKDTSPFVKNLIGKLIILRGVFFAIKGVVLFLISGFLKFTWALAKFALTTAVVGVALKFLLTSTVGLAILHGLMWLLTKAFVAVGFAVGFLIGYIIRLPFIFAMLIIRTGLLIPKLLLLAKVLLVSVVAGFKAAIAAVIGFFMALSWPVIILGALIAAFLAFVTVWIGGWGKVRGITRDMAQWLSDILNTTINWALDAVESALINITKWVNAALVLWVKSFNKFKATAKHTYLFWKNIGKGWEEAFQIANIAAAKYADTLSKVKVGELDLTRSFEDVELDLVKFVNNFEGTVEELKTKIKELWDSMFAGDSSKVIKEMAAGWKRGLSETLKTYENWGQTAKEKATEIAMAIQSSFSNFFFDVFMGEVRTIQDLFASFGRAILRIIADVISQLITAMIMKRMLAAMTLHEGGAIRHEGGLVPIAHEGLAVDERMITAQVGEGVLSRQGMQNIGGEQGLAAVNAGAPVGGGQVINLTQVIQAWSPEEIYRNSKMLSTAMIDELMRNGAFRGAIRKFS